MFSRLGRRPHVGDEVEIGSNYRARVERLDGLRVARVRLVPRREPASCQRDQRDSPLYRYDRDELRDRQMVLQSINPTTEDVIQSFDEFSAQQIDGALQQAHDAQRQLAHHVVRRARGASAERGAGAARAEGAAGRSGHGGDGQADRRGRSRSREVRLELRLLRRARRHASCADEHVATDARRRATSRSSRWAWCWRSCRGTSRSGRCCASPRRR